MDLERISRERFYSNPSKLPSLFKTLDSVEAFFHVDGSEIDQDFVTNIIGFPDDFLPIVLPTEFPLVDVGFVRIVDDVIQNDSFHYLAKDQLCIQGRVILDKGVIVKKVNKPCKIPKV